MVAKSNILIAAREIETALGRFELGSGPTKVCVFETDWGHLRALVGSDGFTGINPGERQRRVLDYLKDNVRHEYVGFLIAVHPVDLDEFDRQVLEP